LLTSSALIPAASQLSLMITYLGARNRYRDKRQKVQTMVLNMDHARGRREGGSVNEKTVYGQ